PCCEFRCERVVDHVQRRSNEKPVAIERSELRVDDVDDVAIRRCDSLQRTVEAQKDLLLVVVTRVGLKVDRPARVIGMEEPNTCMGRRATKSRANFSEFSSQLLNLGKDGVGFSVRSDNRAMILLLPVKG